jgi:hypothetical protein
VGVLDGHADHVAFLYTAGGSRKFEFGGVDRNGGVVASAGGVQSGRRPGTGVTPQHEAPRRRRSLKCPQTS